VGIDYPGRDKRLVVGKIVRMFEVELRADLRHYLLAMARLIRHQRLAN
jgi:hypothetical protein